MRIQRSVETSAAAERVWHFLVEPEKIPEWCVPAKRLRHTGAQRGVVGTTFYFEEKIAGIVMKLDCVITERVVNKRVAFRMTSGNLIRGYEQRYTIESIPRGSRYTLRESIKLPYGILGMVAGLFARSGSEARVKDMLFKLKSMSEA